MKPARPCWRQHSTDLILRLVPVFQIPVPQDHLKQTRSIEQMSECCLCVFAHADMHFYTERANFLLLRCVCVFTGGTARSRTCCQLPLHAAIWICSVVTVYIEDFLDCATHFLLQVCTSPLAVADCDMPLMREKEKRKPLKPPQCVYNRAVRSYLATTTSIGSVSALTVGNQTATCTPYSNVYSRLRNARVHSSLSAKTTCDRWWSARPERKKRRCFIWVLRFSLVQSGFQWFLLPLFQLQRILPMKLERDA